MRQRHEVQLTFAQRELCRAVMEDAKEGDTVRRRAGILFHSDKQEPWHTSDGDVADEMGIDERTVRRVRTAFVTHGFEKTLRGGSLDPTSSARVSPRQEARLLILSATPPPPSYPRWTVRTLAEELHGFAGVHRVSRELVRRILIKHKSSAHTHSLREEQPFPARTS